MRPTSLTLTAGALLATTALLAPLAAQAPASLARPASDWTMPRTPDGAPDLQGNWSNATVTPLERPAGQGPVLTPAVVARIEKGIQDRIARLSQPSDPDRPAPPEGGDGSTGAAGNVGGYNNFWIDAGERVAVVNGEYRTSLIVDPPDGKVPALTDAGRARQAERQARARQFGQYDNPENRPLAERCIASFGSNAGPPMLPNYFYNNNYTIVQTPDHVMILTEMVHDVRIIRLGRNLTHLPRDVRPWWGDSIGWWEGDELVIETTNFHPDQIFRGASDTLKVTERILRADERTLLYRFTIDDPETFTSPWRGEVPFTRLDELIYEYACHEGNYALSNVLSGERSQERAKQTPKQQE
ncbi:MAG: hypothetical protein AB7O93_12640 [Vicinamibacterales bacterium]